MLRYIQSGYFISLFNCIQCLILKPEKNMCIL